MNSAERLKTVREKTGLSQQAFADSLNQKKQSITNIEIGRQGIPVELALAIESQYGYAFRWLMTGEGNMLIEGTSTPTTLVQVPIYDVYASAGHGCINDTEEIIGSIPFDKNFITKILSANPKTLAIICASGDSMSPTINDNDFLLIDLSKNTFTKDGIYAIRCDGHLSVKRLMMHINNEIRIKSDNHLYGEVIVDLNIKKVDIVGRVVWHGHSME